MPICPFATQRLVGAGSSSSFVGGAVPWRIVHHTTEGGTLEGVITEFEHHWSPHFVVTETEIVQLLDTSRPGAALEHPAGTIETNNYNCIQFESLAFAGWPKPHALLENIRKLCRWIEATHGVAKVWPNGPATPPNALHLDAGHHNRSEDGWRKSGHFNHADVPNNCVSADTLILCADLQWRCAGDLKEGDELIAFEDNPTEWWGRKFCKSTVIHNKVVQDALLAVHTPMGTVRCNHDHPWLVHRRANQDSLSNRWVRACDLSPGYEAWWFGSPWSVERSWEAGWLAGMYDGEGCLSIDPARTTMLAVAQRESETAEALIRTISARTPGASVIRRPGRTESHADMVQVQITSRWESLRVLGSIRPPRLLARADQMWEGGSANRSRSLVPIDMVEDVGTGVIASLETSSKTYIAAGFAMHNTHWDSGYTQAEEDFIMADEPPPIPQPPPPVPAPPIVATYTVVAGDTLGKIAARYGKTVAELVAWNHIVNANEIRVGQILQIL
jgi:hypothetical protein